MSRHRSTTSFAGAALAWCAWALCACSQSHPARDDAGHEDAGPRDAGPMDAGHARDAGDGGHELPDAADDDDGGVDARLEVPCAQQLEDALDGIPEDLDCAGLYDDVPNKVLSPEAHFFKPATELWSDGAGKMRWIRLPPGTKIDRSDPSQWVFPIGTKLFKEFRANGRRVETRLYQKVRDDRWVRATFAWTRNEWRARRSFGADLEDVTLFGRSYHIPSGSECDQCHDGHKDRILGFSEVALGLPGARGMTLEQLAHDDLLTPPPKRTTLRIGDDGTGFAEPALGWLHINCGQSCHNANQNSEAYPSGLRLTLQPNELDGRPPTDFDVMRTAVEVAAKTERFGTDRVRIVPGSPQESLIYELILSRKGPKDQMPPIATQVIDVDHVRVVEAWIRGLH